MQPGPPPEDFQAILSRFHTWAEKHPTSGNGNGHANPAPAEEIREIPYEEAIRRHRDRQAARTPRRTAPSKTKTVPAAQPNPSAPPDRGLPEEDLPFWAATLPVVPDTEPVIELRTATIADPPPKPTNVEALPAALSDVAPAPPRPAKPSPTQKPAARMPKPEPPPQTLTAAASALPQLPAPAFVDPPPAPLASRHRPQRKRASALLQPAIATAVAAPPQRKPTPAAAVARPLAQPAPRGVETSARKKPAVSAARTLAKPARVVARPGIIVPPIAASAKRTAPRPLMGRALPVTATKAKPRTAKHPRFQQILANTVQQPKAALAPNKKREPDRARRITTRFSRAEERRVEKCAAELGITVSAYLRRCALSAVALNPSPDPPAAPSPVKARRASRQPATPPLAVYTPPAPSLFGGWLALLRNRFLGPPPVRFSEDA